MIPDKRIVLLNAATANANGAPFEWNGIGKGSLQVVGTWDTATVTIQTSFDGGTTWTSPSGAVFTADVVTTFESGVCLVRAVLSSVGASTSLSAYLTPQERS